MQIPLLERNVDLALVEFTEHRATNVGPQSRGAFFGVGNPEVRRQFNTVGSEVRQNGVGRRIDQHARLFSDDIGHELNDFINVGAVVNAHHDGRTSRTQQVRGIANAAGDEILVRDNRYAAVVSLNRCVARLDVRHNTFNAGNVHQVSDFDALIQKNNESADVVRGNFL